MATYGQVTDALYRAGWNKEIGVIVLTGAGTRAFGTGGDAGDKKSERAGRGTIGVPIEELHTAIRDVPKPVIAKVRGFAIGGGNVIATMCDLTIAAESAIFGQVGPKVGSVDPGFGTAYLARVVGEKKARELWYLCRRYTAAEAAAMGLVNKVVPDDELDAEVRQVVRGDLRAQPHGDRDREALLQCGLGEHPGHRQHGISGAGSLLRHRRSQGRRRRVSREAQAALQREDDLGLRFLRERSRNVLLPSALLNPPQRHRS